MGLRKMQKMPAKNLMGEQNENGEQKEAAGLAAERGEPDIAEAESLRLSVGYATAAAEEISGDTAISSGLPDGSLALILSDGMGKGIRAAAESRAVARRLRKNLKSGMKPAFAIKEVNRYMLGEEALHQAGPTRCSGAAAGEAECFATVDLLIIDRNAAKAKFYKMGAASSFHLRNGKVKKFEQAALPIGIIPEIRLNHIAVRLKAGDIVVMVSDGITEAARACENFQLRENSRSPADAYSVEAVRTEGSAYTSAAVSSVRTACTPETMRLAKAETGYADGEIRLAGSDCAGGNDGAWLHELLESRTAAELAHLSARRLAGEILDEAVLRYADRERDDLTVAVVKIL